MVRQGRVIDKGRTAGEGRLGRSLALHLGVPGAGTITAFLDASRLARGSRGREKEIGRKGVSAVQDEAEIRRPSTTELVRRLVNNVSSLVDREVDLAKEEARIDAMKVGIGVAALAAAGVLVYTAVAALIVALIVWLASALYPWAIALIVAGVFAILGVIAALIGWTQVKFRPMDRTRRTVSEDVQWVRAQMTSQAR